MIIIEIGYESKDEHSRYNVFIVSHRNFGFKNQNEN